MNILKSLNPEQREGVEATEGYVKVLAGPGTGKTRVLIHRLCHLIQNCKIDPAHILSVTFTNKAAKEMKDRATAMLGDHIETNIFTFHGFCRLFLLKHIDALDYPRPFSIIDQDDQVSILRQIYKKFNLTNNKLPLREMLKNISLYKSSYSYIDAVVNYVPYSESPLELALGDNILSKVFIEYLKMQRTAYALDFDDLLHFTLFILKKEPKVLEYWQELFHYIQVDEFQDVNRAQVELIKLLQEKHKNLFVVGDPDQTIYSWRGSDIGFITNFEIMFPKTKSVTLKTNYRSTTSIVETSNALIKNNTNRIDKPLEPLNKTHDGVLYCACHNIYDEALFVAESVCSLKQHQNAAFRDIAILYRSTQLNVRIEHELLKRGIPYTIVKGTEFFQRQEIKDALAFLKFLVFGDDISFLRIINKPTRHMGKKRIEYLKKYASEEEISLLQALLACREEPLFKHDDINTFIMAILDVKSRLKSLSTYQVLEEILIKTGYEHSLLFDLNSDRIENVRELKRLVKRYEEQYGGRVEISEYLAEVALYAEATENREENSVKLMTIHSAKGLEFPYVIVAGMNEGIFPSARVRSHAEYQEERRLAYVAFTRAQKGLLLTSASGRDYNGFPMTPSRFIEEIPSNIIRKIKRSKDKLYEQMTQY